MVLRLYLKQENAEGPILMQKGREWNIQLPFSVTKAVFSAASFVSQITRAANIWQKRICIH